MLFRWIAVTQCHIFVGVLPVLVAFFLFHPLDHKTMKNEGFRPPKYGL